MFMTVQDAIGLVVELARANILPLEMADSPELQAERDRQITAVDTIEDFAVNLICEA